MTKNKNFLGPSGTVVPRGQFWLLSALGVVLLFGVWTGVAVSGWMPKHFLKNRCLLLMTASSRTVR